MNYTTEQLRTWQDCIEGATFVPPHAADGAGQTGWAYGLRNSQRNRRSGKETTWLIIPGSSYGARLFPSAEEARTVAEFSHPANNGLPAGGSFEVCRVETAFRFGRIWFRVVGD